MSDFITNYIVKCLSNILTYLCSNRKQRKSLYQAAPTLIAHQRHHQERSALTRRDPRKRSRRRRLNQLRKSRNPRRRSNPHHLILIPIHLTPSQLKRDQELPQMFLLPAKPALTKQRKPLKKLLSHKRNLRLSLPPTLIHQILISQLLKERKPQPRKILAPPVHPVILINQLPRKPLLKTHPAPALMLKKRLRLKLPQLLRRPLLSPTSTMVNLNSSFKDSPSIPMRMPSEDSSELTEKCLSANSLWVWEDPREKLSLSTLLMPMLEKHSMELTKKTSMVELSGLSSVDKLLEDTNLKVVPMEHQLVRQTPFSLETLDSELNNGPLKNSSRVAETLTESELLWVKMEDQEVSLTSNLIATLLLLKP